MRRFDGDLMIYDRDLDRANCLNGLAADVWERCDGQSSGFDDYAEDRGSNRPTGR